ncbi:CotH kinase family protein [Neobacillus sp. PS3-40]|uniref:CotH kinase family protein n=1 Tax=Neobacillus sp. PS3-40 TaxID=3070679 RepID=UPI0027E01D08|nr:CotH kinase family protein [Neobacillus sp. PS3-40]WML44108.1 CotH kinase family protein [Neobacillus sp. PS3-40]
MAENNKLETLQLYIHPNNLRELKSDIWCEDPVPAQLKISGKKLEVDVNYRGSHIRNYRKKSYEISFFKPTKYKGSKIIHLNAEYRDPSLLRNKLSFDFFSEIGNLSPYSRHVLLNLNGKTEGVYLEIESVDEQFIERRKLPNGAIFYAVDGDANFSLISDLDKETKKSLELGYERKYGTANDDIFLQELIFKINTIPRADFEKEIPNYLNVEQYFRWMAGVILTQNYDGFVHNYSLYRNSVTRQFEIIPWDYDATWGRDVNGKVMEENYVPIQGYNTLTARLLDVANFRKIYKELLCKIMDHQFTVEYMQPKIESMHQLVRPYVLLDPYKKEKIDQFDIEPSNICSFIESRKRFLKGSLYKLD